ncbi:MAG TPA: adenylate/guanylate cyclase domain-containing protein [Reyranella sp.]|nr:adenylate/guanylate cyclase domain-containing protein [Reyranella sp.]
MRCETCQHLNADDASFCVNCGTTLVAVCPRCARRNVPLARFCAGCGTRLQGAAPPAEPPPPSAANAALLNTRAAREGERKRVTVLFADIAGSTGLVEKLDPEDAARLLNAVTASMREAVSRFEGTVNKLQGDGIMALFGAPIPQEDHPVRACCAALAMIENVRGIEGAPSIRVGIHTGEVVVQAVANDVSAQYEAMGVAVHMAARLEGQAELDGVAISKATLRAAGGAVVVEAVGERQLRGITEPVPVYLLRDIRSTGTSQQFQGGQRLSPFVGRDLEMTVLRRALDAANAGASRVLGIVGEAGSGKSRMVFEFLEACRNDGRAVLEARATAHGRAAPLQPILGLMRAFFGIDEETPPTEAILKVRAVAHRVDAMRDAPLLLDFLGLPLAAGENVPADIAGRRARLLDAVKHLARTTALAGPAVLVIEDLHWLDPASEPFVEAIAQAVTGTKTLLLVDFRPGYRAPWMERSFYEQVSLVPMAAGAVGLMLDRLIGNDPSLTLLRARIVDRAAGNPFFAEELVRALIENGALGGEPGAYTATDRTQDAPLPETVQSVLSSRIDHLDEPDKLLLQAAATIGREFPLAVAAEVAASPEVRARESLHRLLGAEMVYERPDLQRDAFAFRHPLVQEAAYTSLLSERRRELHRRAATALSAHYKDRADETAALIAHHWEEAGDVMQAAAAYVKAALWIGTRDPRQALEAWRKVRRLLEGAAPATPVDYMMMMACGQIVNYAWREGIDATEVEPVFEQAMTLARKLKDMRAAALITMAFGRVLAATGSAQEYVEKVEEAQRLVEGTHMPSTDAVLSAVLSHALSTANRLDEALAANEKALACVDKIDARDRQTLGFHPEHWLTAQRARTLMLLDRMNEAEPLVERLLTGAIGDADTLHRALAVCVRLEGAAREGNGRQAMAEAEALAELLAGSETPYLRVLHGRNRALALRAAGKLSAAIDEMRATLTYAEAQRAGLEMRPRIVDELASALAAANGRIDEPMS